MSRRLLTALLAAGAAGALAAPAAAEAAVRHAAANGSGSACSAAAPCLFQQALDGAAVNDEIVVHAGTHQAYQAATINRVTITGAAGEAMPTIEAQAAPNGCGIATRAAGSAVRRVRIRVTAVGASGLCVGDHALVEQVVIVGTHADVSGLWMRQADWARIDALSVNLPTTGGRGIEVHDSRNVQLDNVSLRAADAALWVDGDVSSSVVSVRNSFLDSPEEAVQISCHAVTAYSLVQASSSAVGAVDEGPCGFSGSDANIPIAGTDVSADAQGVLRPGPGSTLLDAGRRDDSETAARDVDGDPRVLGARMDIGADELRLAPTKASVSASELTQTAATLSGFALGHGAEQLTATFELGATSAYGQTIPAEIVASGGRLNLPVARARVNGLAPGTTYHARLVLRNEWGMEAVGDDGLFTTPAEPVDPGPGGGGGGGAGGSGGGAGGSGGGAGGGAGGSGGGTGGGGTGGRAGDRRAPRCTVAIARARRAGRIVVRGRCDEPARLRLAIARKGAKPKLVTVRVPGGRRFAKRVVVGRLATAGRRIAITARDAAGNAAKPLGVKVRRR